MRNLFIRKLKYILALSLMFITPNKSEEERECYEDNSDSFCLPLAPKNVEKESLFFITPWNKIGYEHVTTHGAKIDFVSPTWFYLEKNKTTSKFEFQGRQDILPDFLLQVRKANPTVKILPRFYISGDREEFKWALRRNVTSMLFNELKSIAEEYGLDGFVFDIPILNYVKYKKSVKIFLDSIKSEFENQLKFVTFFGTRIQVTKKVDEIKPYADIFDKIIVCTYNYPRGWLNPISWYRENADFYKKAAEELKLKDNFFMLGIQFYGYIEDLKSMSRRELIVDE